jgi:hypothetical protein
MNMRVYPKVSRLSHNEAAAAAAATTTINIH